MKKLSLSVATILAINALGVADVVADDRAGPYGGLQAGYNWGDVDTSSWHSDPQDLHEFSLSGFDVNGFAGGIFAGHMLRVSNDILLGVEGEWNWGSADDTVINDDEPEFPYGAKIEQDWNASLRLIAGKDMGDYMPYITGGIAWAEVDVHGFTDWDEGQFGSNRYANHNASLTGWTIGAGLEKKVGENFHARIQYRYSDYGDDTWEITEQPNDVDSGKVEYSGSMLTVGLSYRF